MSSKQQESSTVRTIPSLAQGSVDGEEDTKLDVIAPRRHGQDKIKDDTNQEVEVLAKKEQGGIIHNKESSNKQEEPEIIKIKRDGQSVEVEDEDDEEGDDDIPSRSEENTPSPSPPRLDLDNPKSFCGAFAACTRSIRNILLAVLQWFSRVAATRPLLIIPLVLITSITLILVGYFTNFFLQTITGNLWSPVGSISRTQANYYYYNSTFEHDPLYLDFLIHANGDNVLEVEGVRRVFEVQDKVTTMENYLYLCEKATEHWFLGRCQIHSVADFWNEDFDAFQEEVMVNLSSYDEDADAAVVAAISATKYPSGLAVDRSKILGRHELGNNTGSAADSDGHELTYSASYLIRFDVPRQYYTSGPTREFIAQAIDYMLETKYAWEQDPTTNYRLEIFSYETFITGFNDAILEDLPLIPSVVVIMSLFTAAVFAKCRDRVQSRSLLGFGAVLTVLCAVMTGFGICFAAGIEASTVTGALPFIMLGIGLDDSFILFGSYSRTDPKLDTNERIRLTMNDCGVSIFLTTLTSTVAFSLGVYSSIPAIQCVCVYASVTIAVDFVYQITFFISLLVLDERRIKAGRSDCICWKLDHSKDYESAVGAEDEPEETPSTNIAGLDKNLGDHDTSPNPTNEKHLADRIMGWYAEVLLTPAFQCSAGILFAAVFAWSIYNTIHLHQEFSWAKTLPQGSHFTDYIDAMDQFGPKQDGIITYAWFRYVDFSDSGIRLQMEEYMQSLYIDGPFLEPANFWLRDFMSFVESSANSTFSYDGKNGTLANLPFREQIIAFLGLPGHFDAYRPMLSFESGEVVAAKCLLHLPVDLQDARDGIEKLEALRNIDKLTPANQNIEPQYWPFFTYFHEYQQWEFYGQVRYEMAILTVVGITVITVVSYIFIPHWTATLFVFPSISLLYLDMLAWLNLTQIHVSPISYVIVLCSIGLMVDFILHILMRYYDSTGTRRERVKETLTTVGASILLGAFTTFLGVLLLAFSKSTVVQTVFICFTGLIGFGVLHGLVFLPVLLSIVGP